eukprot:m.543835 g.543835  ORF g.543835 m.543835 type:complete len:132 (-) comp57667_c0_seq90:292-687(-)
MIAATSGSPAVEALLQAGAVSSITNKSGETAKDRAVKRSWAVVVNILQDQEEFLAQVGSRTKRASGIHCSNRLPSLACRSPRDFLSDIAVLSRHKMTPKRHSWFLMVHCKLSIPPSVWGFVLLSLHSTPLL